MHPVVLTNVARTYRLDAVDVPALVDNNLVILPNRFPVISGPSGSGKTTLLNLIGCVDTPTSGTVIVNGHDTTRLSERALTDLRLRTLGFIFQSFNLVSVLSVFQNVEYPLLLQGGTTRKQRADRVLALLDAVGIGSYARHRPSELSGGQRQRVAIARALVTRPQIVLADEPTANLDSKTGETIIDLMKEMNAKDGTTFIFSTHDPKVMAHANAVVRIADGRLAGREDLAAPAAGGAR